MRGGNAKSVHFIRTFSLHSLKGNLWRTVERVSASWTPCDGTGLAKVCGGSMYFWSRAGGTLQR